MLSVVATADLGGLGSTQGPGTIYNWTRPSLLPVLLPWMFLLGLLTLKPNRHGQAWLIWVPVGLLFGVAALVAGGLVAGLMPGDTPSQALDMLTASVIALTFGLGAVWLVIPYLGLKYRFLSFLGSLVVMAFFAGLAWVLREGLEGGIEQAVQGVIPIIGSGGIAVALALTGLACRGRYHPFRLLLLLLSALLTTWLLVTVPFLIIALIANQGSPPLDGFLAFLGMITLLSFAVVLPFLVLSFASVFYRDRLKAFLKLGTGAPPLIPIEPPVAEPVAK
jgi:hypothetical protein